MPLVTVVTAAQNVADLLPETIASIQAQTMRDWELVVVDDASSDATPDVVARCAASDSRVRLVRLESSLGSYGAANVAMLGADAKYLARIDGDDLATPERLERQVALMQAKPWAKGAASAWRALTPAGLEPPIRTVPTHRNAVIKWMMFFRSNLVHSTLMVDTEFFQALGGYGPERVAEDFRLWSALVRADALAVSDEALVAYRFRPGQVTASPGSRMMPARARVTLDHIAHCTDDPWDLDDARDLRFVGEGDAPVTVARAMSLVDRFERSWRADHTLAAGDREELERHTAMRRLRHLRHTVRRQPAQVGFAAIRRAPTIAASALRVTRNRGTSWP